MKKTLLIALTVVFVLGGGCDKWEKDVNYNGIEFEKFSHEAMRGALAQDTLIQGYPCKKGFLTLYDDGKLKMFRASKPFEYSDFTIPQETWCILYEDGKIKICMFPKDTLIQGYLCRGCKMGLEGVRTRFHVNGKLNCFFTRDDVEIDSVVCKGSVFHPIGLHDNGKLRNCTLAKDAEIAGITYHKGAKLQLDKEGKILAVTGKSSANLSRN